jgi:predicted nuclease of predicted toxin-antitoxin system
VRLKLDENIGCRGLDFLRARGHDVMTVREQNLHGVTDDSLFDICVAEGRALVTLDRDFAQVLRFPPETSAGIIVLDAGPRATLQAIINRLDSFLEVAETTSAAGALWIVEPGRVGAAARGDGPHLRHPGFADLARLRVGDIGDDAHARHLTSGSRSTPTWPRLWLRRSRISIF